MPFLKTPTVHHCKLPNVVWRGGKPRPIGTQWYCPNCYLLYTLMEDQRDGAYWETTGQKYEETRDAR